MSITDEYIAGLDEPQKTILASLCHIIQEVAPDATAAYSYGVPGFRYKDKFMIGFAANKNFMSIYPGSTAISAHASLLKDFTCSKGAIRFTTEQPIPQQTLQKIIAFRKAEMDL